MRDPYEVLGISRNANMQQIRKAYKNLAKKAASLPDTQNDVRMEELNDAYDAIMNERGAYGGGRAEDSGYSGYDPAYGDEYDDIRRLINEGRYPDAETLLDGIPADRRTPEWHFLKGKVLYNKGWLDEASGEFEAAYRAQPSNREFRDAYENVFSKRTGGYRPTGDGGSGGCGVCDICSGLLCADCCCECMGGDLIKCC